MYAMWMETSWTVLDTELHIILTKTHRREDGKVTEKETAREARKVESSKEEKAETKGKEKVEGKKGQRLNEITEPSEEQWTGGSWEQLVRTILGC